MSSPLNPLSKAYEIKKLLSQGCSSFKHVKYFQGRLLRLGFDQDNYLVNMILKCCIGFKEMDYARLIFYQMIEPNIFLWNTMVRGFVSHEHFEDGIEFYGLMRNKGFLPNHFTFPFVLKACARTFDFELGKKVHTIVMKVGFGLNVYVQTSLLCLYAKWGNLKDAHKLFVEMPSKNVVSWTVIICGYIEDERIEEAIGLFRKLLEMNLMPDSFTLVRILSACTVSGDLHNGEWIHEYIKKRGMGQNLFVSTSLIDMYFKCGRMEKAQQVFDKLVERDVVSWSTMITGYASSGFPKEALDLFSQMQSQNLHPDSYAIVGVLTACARLGALEFGEKVRNLIHQNDFLSNPVLGTALIDLYAKCGDLNKAWDVFQEMIERDTIVWNAMIFGLAMGGQEEVAFSLFSRMEKLGIKPDGNTFIGLLCSCTHSGLVGDGWRYFNSMTQVYMLTPRIEHYGCMVDLLGRAGLLNEAYKLIQELPMEANAVVWGALLGGCRLHRNIGLAEVVLEKLIELEPKNSGNYVLLSNIYSSSKRWDDAANLRLIMNEKGVTKIPGYSWIEVNGIVHEFLVGDRSHPLWKDIYTKLDDLSNKLRAMGYVPTTDLVLFDIEEEEKEHFLGYHSEKIAIAFGLISTNQTEVIRIVKNLRVCSDCHEAIKLISRITSRELIVRDNNRFHCFKDGLCSCNDFW